MSQITEAIQAIAHAEINQLRADRVRLDWLERTGAAVRQVDNGDTQITIHCRYAGYDFYGATYRNAIDAAMQKEALSLTKQTKV